MQTWSIRNRGLATRKNSSQCRANRGKMQLRWQDCRNLCLYTEKLPRSSVLSPPPEIFTLEVEKLGKESWRTLEGRPPPCSPSRHFCKLRRYYDNASEMRVKRTEKNLLYFDRFKSYQAAFK